MLDPRTEIFVTPSGDKALKVSIRCILGSGDEDIVLTPDTNLLEKVT